MLTATNDKARVHPASLKSNPWPSMTEHNCSRHRYVDTRPKSVTQGSVLNSAARSLTAHRLLHKLTKYKRPRRLEPGPVTREENAAPHHEWDNTIKAFRSFKADLRLLTPPSRPSSSISSDSLWTTKSGRCITSTWMPHSVPVCAQP